MLEAAVWLHLRYSAHSNPNWQKIDLISMALDCGLRNFRSGLKFVDQKSFVQSSWKLLKFTTNIFYRNNFSCSPQCFDNPWCSLCVADNADVFCKYLPNQRDKIQIDIPCTFMFRNKLSQSHNPHDQYHMLAFPSPDGTTSSCTDDKNGIIAAIPSNNNFICK